MEEDDYDPDDLITVVVVPPDCVRFYTVKRISAKYGSRKLDFRCMAYLKTQEV